MRITILCSSELHPINPYLRAWIARNHDNHRIDLVQSKRELTGGDVLFLISCSEIVTESERNIYKKTLVLHASDLPRGRGWSPHIWQILDGATQITVTLLEAENKVDTGAIWRKISVAIAKDALWDEINHEIFEAELELMDYAVENFEAAQPMPQSRAVEATYYPKRTALDSKVDPAKSIEEQFDLIRVADPIRFPSYFELHGNRYIIRLEKANA